MGKDERKSDSESVVRRVAAVVRDYPDLTEAILADATRRHPEMALRIAAACIKAEPANASRILNVLRRSAGQRQRGPLGGLFSSLFSKDPQDDPEIAEAMREAARRRQQGDLESSLPPPPAAIWEVAPPPDSLAESDAEDQTPGDWLQPYLEEPEEAGPPPERPDPAPPQQAEPAVQEPAPEAGSEPPPRAPDPARTWTALDLALPDDDGDGEPPLVLDDKPDLSLEIAEAEGDGGLWPLSLPPGGGAPGEAKHAGAEVGDPESESVAAGGDALTDLRIVPFDLFARPEAPKRLEAGQSGGSEPRGVVASFPRRAPAAEPPANLPAPPAARSGSGPAAVEADEQRPSPAEPASPALSVDARPPRPEQRLLGSPTESLTGRNGSDILYGGADEDLAEALLDDDFEDLTLLDEELEDRLEPPPGYRDFASPRQVPLLSGAGTVAAGWRGHREEPEDRQEPAAAPASGPAAPDSSASEHAASEPLAFDAYLSGGIPAGQPLILPLSPAAPEDWMESDAWLGDEPEAPAAESLSAGDSAAPPETAAPAHALPAPAQAAESPAAESSAAKAPAEPFGRPQEVVKRGETLRAPAAAALTAAALTARGRPSRRVGQPPEALSADALLAEPAVARRPQEAAGRETLPQSQQEPAGRRRGTVAPPEEDRTRGNAAVVAASGGLVTLGADDLGREVIQLQGFDGAAGVWGYVTEEGALALVVREASGADREVARVEGLVSHPEGFTGVEIAGRTLDLEALIAGSDLHRPAPPAVNAPPSAEAGFAGAETESLATASYDMAELDDPGEEEAGGGFGL